MSWRIIDTKCGAIADSRTPRNQDVVCKRSLGGVHDGGVYHHLGGRVQFNPALKFNCKRPFIDTFNRITNSYRLSKKQLLLAVSVLKIDLDFVNIGNMVKQEQICRQHNVEFELFDHFNGRRKGHGL